MDGIAPVKKLRLVTPSTRQLYGLFLIATIFVVDIALVLVGQHRLAIFAAADCIIFLIVSLFFDNHLDKRAVAAVRRLSALIMIGFLLMVAATVIGELIVFVQSGG